MEKKRRARINTCLEQLRALLERHYSHQVGPRPGAPHLPAGQAPSGRSHQLLAHPQIRKRRLEKADILELSVKYMKSLQSSVHGRGRLRWGAGGQDHR